MGPKIAIIGGGIGGLTAAVALARRGLDAEIYEQAAALEEVGAGVGLWPNALRALEPIGLAGKVGQLAESIARQGLKRPDGTWLMYFPTELMEKRWGARLHRRAPSRAAEPACQPARRCHHPPPCSLYRLPGHRQGRDGEL